MIDSGIDGLGDYLITGPWRRDADLVATVLVTVVVVTIVVAVRVFRPVPMVDGLLGHSPFARRCVTGRRGAHHAMER